MAISSIGISKHAIGVMVDGLDVKIAYLAREGGSIVLKAIKRARLKKRMEERIETGEIEALEGELPGIAEEQADQREVAQEETAPETEEDILGLDAMMETEPEPEVELAAEGGGEDVEAEDEEENNASILFSALGEFPIRQSLLGVNLLEPSVDFFDLANTEGLKGKKLKKWIESEIENIKGQDGGINDDNLGYFQVDGTVVSALHSDPMELLSSIDQLKFFFNTNVRVSVIDINEVALMNLVRLSETPEDEVTAIIYIGTDFSRVVFLRGSEYLGFAQVINEGFDSPQVLTTIFSRILFAQDVSDIPDIDRIILAGESKSVNAQEFFSGQFPESRIEYLVPDMLDTSQIERDQVDLVSVFAIPIALAWKVLDPQNERFYPTNLLPGERKRRQNPFHIAWHGLSLIALLAGTALYLGFQYEKNIDAIVLDNRKVELQIKQIEDATPLADTISIIENRIGELEAKISRIDTVSSDYNRWSRILKKMVEETDRTNSIWFDQMKSTDEGISLSGRALQRNKIHEIASSFGVSRINQITRSELRGKEIFSFQFDALYDQIIPSEPEEELEVAPTDEKDEEPQKESLTKIAAMEGKRSLQEKSEQLAEAQKQTAHIRETTAVSELASDVELPKEKVQEQEVPVRGKPDQETQVAKAQPASPEPISDVVPREPLQYAERLPLDIEQLLSQRPAGDTDVIRIEDLLIPKTPAGRQQITRADRDLLSAQKGEITQVVAVRAWAHDRFSRVVFQLNKTSDFNFSEGEKTVTLKIENATIMDKEFLLGLRNSVIESLEISAQGTVIRAVISILRDPVIESLEISTEGMTIRAIISITRPNFKIKTLKLPEPQRIVVDIYPYAQKPDTRTGNI